MDVQVGRHHVVVPRHDEGHIRGDELLAVLVKPLEPREIAIEFGSGRGIAVRWVETSHGDTVNGGFDIATVKIVGITRKAPSVPSMLKRLPRLRRRARHRRRCRGTMRFVVLRSVKAIIALGNTFPRIDSAKAPDRPAPRVGALIVDSLKHHRYGCRPQQKQPNSWISTEIGLRCG